LIQGIIVLVSVSSVGEHTVAGLAMVMGDLKTVARILKEND